MYLHKLKVSGYKRLSEVELSFNDATFLIGQNNSGKSSLLQAIGFLLGNKQIPVDCFYAEVNADSSETERVADNVTMEAEFRNVGSDADEWRGFKGRIFENDSEDESKLSIFYKKEWVPGKLQYNI